ncbi:CesT family type III secretion system chaperone [Erwinia pyri]|uniref:CesT family type III secretion system chaperone n=1 Tax=Erwinia pyri TaxID=3062598 RepID=A0AA50DJM2_9GAMM|nr:CesT family type III secretion system chaperone [Erwinia sp. DE2]WLS78972.1 CesT family type III secretion system chaperone [Erwinia sp. DE2]
MPVSCAVDRLLRPLLRHLNVNAPALAENQGVNIDFEHISIQFTPLNKDELLMVASLGCLPLEHHKDLAWLLLRQNNFYQPTPAINLTVEGHDKTVLLWSRERFANLDSSALITLFDRLVDRANETVRLISAHRTRF